jgi:uncharacterized protein involved in outer membrane biogenesis
MATTPSPDSASPKRRGGLLRKLGILFGVLLALLVIGYFVLTSGAFFKGVILPKVGAAMNSEVTAGDASISPFSQVTLTDFKVQPKGVEPLFTAKEIRLRYSLMSILGGTIAVQEIFVDSPAVTLVQNADGTSNLDPILKASTSSSSAPTTAPSSPLKLVLDIQNVTVKNASLKQTTKFKEGGEQVVDVGGGSFNLTNLKNGQSAKLDLGADIGFRTSQPTNATLGARFDGKLTITVGSDGLPQTISGGTKLAINQATGLFAELAQSAAVLDCDMSPTEIKGIVLKLQRANTDLAALRLAGPFDATKREGTLKLEAFGIDRNVLNLAGRSAGLDFGTTVFASTNTIVLSNGGQSLALNGQVLGSKLSVTQAGVATPALEVAASYDVTVDQAKEVAVLRALNLTALRGANILVEGVLSKPMRIEWAKGANAVDESDFKLTLVGLDLREYRAFTGTNVQGGLINGVLDIQSKSAGKQLALTLNASGADLAAAADGAVYATIGFTLKSIATVQNFEQLQIKEGDFRLTHRGQEALRAQATGNVNLTNQNLTLALLADASLPVLAGLSPVPGTALTGGTLNFTGAVKQENVSLPGAKTPAFSQTVDGNLTVAGLNGKYGEYLFDTWGAKVDFDLGMKDDLATVRKLAGALSQGGQPAGAFDVKADSQLVTGASKLTLKLTDLNQRALAPFLNAALDGKKLQSIAINANLDGGYDPKADSTLRGTASVTNLVVIGDGLPAKPLEAAFDLDVALRKQTAEIRSSTLKLTPTARGKNEVKLTGTVDFSNTNAFTGALKLVADTLDFTPYYDLFMAAPGTPAKPASAAKPVAAQPAADPNVEPPATILPVRNFVTEATIGHLYLRDLDVAAFATTVKLDGGRTLVDPFKATLNGAPVNGKVDFDMGVPGYKYDVAFSATSVPVPPFVSLAMPERVGQFGGTATATLNLKGAGVTDANIAKNLAGDFYLGTTNLNFMLVNAKSSLMKTIINVVVTIPDLLRNPAGGLTDMLSKLTGAATGSTPGWADQIMSSPVDVIVMRGQVGAGRMQVQEATVRSPAFMAQLAGDITLAPVLTNSALKLPLQVSLARALADKVKVVPTGTPTNAIYAKLPDFVTIKGTVGAAKTDINALALAGLALQGGAGMVGTNNAVGSALGTLNSLLSGGSSTPAAGGSNAAPSTSSSLQNALSGLLGGGAKPATNATTGTNAAPAPAPAFNPLDLFKKKK